MVKSEIPVSGTPRRTADEPLFLPPASPTHLRQIGRFRPESGRESVEVRGNARRLVRHLAEGDPNEALRR
ncbi:hypothetical protein ACFQ63_00605 [Streptomyces wedmorensis]|uniref:Uncharacterized protein n=1 Tax=Streptomyces wedmorensis TaxID=43759 RepID=A0ABW6IMP1_STRWE